MEMEWGSPSPRRSTWAAGCLADCSPRRRPTDAADAVARGAATWRRRAIIDPGSLSLRKERVVTDSPFGPVVSTAWLAERLGDPDLRVLDATWYMPHLRRDARAEFEA